MVSTASDSGLKLPAVERPKVIPLGLDEVVAIREAMPARYRAVVTLAAGSGLRLGELFGLTVDRVDWLRRTIRIDRQMVTVRGKGASLAPVKTPSSVRTIPVPDVVLGALSEHLASRPAADDGLIFTTEDARPVTRNNAGHLWRRATGKVDGLPEDADGWYALCHFYASVLISAGESVKVVQERLGHASAAVTLDTYTDLWPSDADRTRSAVGGRLG
jgi:integrase